MLFAAALTAFACSKDQTDPTIDNPDAPERMTLRFRAESVDEKPEDNASAPDTRTTFAGGEGEDRYNIKWKDDTDEIGVYIASAQPSDNAQALPIRENGVIYFMAEEVNAYTADDAIYAYYPYSAENAAATAAGIRLAIPAAQEQTASGVFDGRYNPMVAVPTRNADQAAGVIVKFRQMAAMAEFDIYSSDAAHEGETVRTISFASTGKEAIAGSFAYDLTQVSEGTLAAIDAAAMEDASSTVTVTVREGEAMVSTETGLATLYMALVPGTYTGDVTITTDKAVYTFAGKTIDFQRAYVKRFKLNLANAKRTEPAIYEIQATMGSTASKTTWEANGWIFENFQAATEVYGIRLGTGSKKGSATSPIIEMPEKFELTFNAVAWDGASENTILIVSVLDENDAVLYTRNVEIKKQTNFSGSSPQLSEADAMSATNSYSLTFPGSGKRKISIVAQNDSNNRFALSYVKIASTDAEITLPPTIVAEDITDISDAGVTDASFTFSIENDKDYTATAEADGTIVTAARIEGRTVTYTVSQNYGEARDGSITIRLNDEFNTQKTVKVSQAATTVAPPSGEEVTFDLVNTYTTTSGTDQTTGINFKFENNGGTAPTWNSNSKEIRMYAKNKLTINGGGQEIIGIHLEIKSYGSAGNTISANIGTWAKPDWHGSAEEVILTTGGSSGHEKITSITVTYKADTTPKIEVAEADKTQQFAATTTEGTIAFTAKNLTADVTAAVSGADWFTATVDNPAGTVAWTATENTGSTPRTATLTLSSAGADDVVIAIEQLGQAQQIVMTEIAVDAEKTTATGLTVTFDAVEGAAGFRWSATPTAGGQAVTGSSEDGQATSLTITGLQPATEYTVEVTAVANGTTHKGEASKTATATTKEGSAEPVYKLYYKYSGEQLGSGNSYTSYTKDIVQNTITVNWTATIGSNQSSPQGLWLGVNKSNVSKAKLSDAALAAAVGATTSTTNIAALIDNTSMSNIGKVVFTCSAAQSNVKVYLVALTDSEYKVVGEQASIAASTEYEFTFERIPSAKYALVAQQTGTGNSVFVQIRVPQLTFYTQQ